jgi:hypothetical protein
MLTPSSRIEYYLTEFLKIGCWQKDAEHCGKEYVEILENIGLKQSIFDH